MDIHSLKYGPLIDGKVQTLKEGFYKWMDGMERKMMISSLHTDIHNGYIKLYEQKTQKLDIFFMRDFIVEAKRLWAFKYNILNKVLFRLLFFI